MMGIINNLNFPIQVFNLKEINLDIKKIQDFIKKNEDHYQVDNYLLHKNKLDYIQKVMDNHIDINDYNDINMNFSERFPELSQEFINIINNFLPSRKRLISEYIIKIQSDNSIKIDRIEHTGFCQPLALSMDTGLDYRLSKRIFKELPDHMYHPDIRKIISYLSEKLYQHLHLTEFKIIVHHTIVTYINNPYQISTNSPEGIHQDGMDYIVSALVIERNNIDGAQSIIYGNDKKTPIFQTILQEGEGIFQPDNHTDLWHEVTSIYPKDRSKTAYRSTLGFDIEVLK